MGALTGIGIFIEWENVFSTMETSKSAFMTGYLLLVVGRSFACCILWMRRSKQVVKLIKLLDLFDRTVLEAFHDNCVDSRNSTKWTVIPLISIISLFSLLNMDLTRFFLKFAPVTNSSSYAIIMTFIVISMWQVSPTFLYAYFISAIKENFIRVNKIFVKMFPEVMRGEDLAVSAIKENFIRVNKIFVKMFPEVMRGEDLAGIDLEFLANMRLCHGMMADAVKLINKSFGTFLIDWDGIMGRLHVRFDFTTVYVLLVMLRSFNCCYFCLVRSKKFLKLVKLLHLFDLNIIEVFKENSVDDRSFLKCTIAPMIYCVICTFFLNIELVTFFIRAISKTRFDDERFYILVATYSVMMFWQIGPMFLYQYFAFSLNINFRRMNSAFFEMFPIENWYLESISVDDIAANIKNVVKDIRQLHILMADVVKLLNRTYGLLLAVEYFFIRVAIAINLYILVFSPVNTSYMLFGSVVSAFVTLYLSDNVAKEAFKNCITEGLVI
ncbi:hypothetical protein QE152_g40130 [Popillia japonica]|uniref:Gustatory receptor n=1 Tax=Popillia japonica TaxID=7064 RepID=A0AAW1HS98_POPJA